MQRGPAAVMRALRRAFTLKLAEMDEFRRAAELMERGCFAESFALFQRCRQVVGQAGGGQDLPALLPRLAHAAFKAGLRAEAEQAFKEYVVLLRRENAFPDLYKAYVRHVRMLQRYDLGKAARLCRALLSEEERAYIPVEQCNQLLFEAAVGSQDNLRP